MRYGRKIPFLRIRKLLSMMISITYSYIHQHFGRSEKALLECEQGFGRSEGAHGNVNKVLGDLKVLIGM